MNNLQIANKSQFTEKELERIYEFLDQYVPGNKVEAKHVMMSIIRYDRVIYKNRIVAALQRVL